MDSNVYYCMICNKLYKTGQAGKKIKCPRCKQILCDLNISESEYKKLNSLQKQTVKDNANKKGISSAEMPEKSNKEKKDNTIDSGNKYKNWLRDIGMTESVVRNYVRLLKKLDEYMKENRYTDCSIYDMNVEELVELNERLNGDEELKKNYRESMTSFRKYIYFRSGGSIQLGRHVERSSEQDEKSIKYKEWLETTGLKGTVVRNYMRWLKNLDGYVKETGYTNRSIYDMNVEELVELNERLNGDDDVKNNHKDHMVSFRKYIYFRSEGRIQLAKSVRVQEETRQEGSEYKEWLESTGLKTSAVRSYVRWLRNLDSYVKETGHTDLSIYDMNVEELVELNERLNGDEEVRNNHKDHIASLRKYIYFRSGGSIQLSRNVEKSSEQDKKSSKYKEWLESTGLKGTAVRNYVRWLRNLDEYVKETGYTDRSIYDMNVEELVELNERLNKDEEVKNNHKDHMVSYRKYIYFRSEGSIQLSRDRNVLSEQHPQRIVYQEWLESIGMKRRAARNYGNWLNNVSLYSAELGYLDRSIYDIDDINVLIQIYEKISRDEYFLHF